MADTIDETDDTVQEAREAARIRRETEERENPSGHGTQVTPRQQEHIAETSDNAADATAAVFDDDALEDLKGDNRP
jgi:hypothetical protein